jgi:hypothetical protein
MNMPLPKRPSMFESMLGSRGQDNLHSLLADHLRPALGTGTVNAALTGNMRFSMPALGVRTNTITVRTRAGFITAAAATSLTLGLACPLALTESIT